MIFDIGELSNFAVYFSDYEGVDTPAQTEKDSKIYDDRSAAAQLYTTASKSADVTQLDLVSMRGEKGAL